MYVVMKKGGEENGGGENDLFDTAANKINDARKCWGRRK